MVKIVEAIEFLSFENSYGFSCYELNFDGFVERLSLRNPIMSVLYGRIITSETSHTKIDSLIPNVKYK